MKHFLICKNEDCRFKGDIVEVVENGGWDIDLSIYIPICRECSKDLVEREVKYG